MSASNDHNPETCPQPECQEPNVHARHTHEGREFRRCPACSWSWFTVVRTTDGEVT